MGSTLFWFDRGYPSSSKSKLAYLPSRRMQNSLEFRKKWAGLGRGAPCVGIDLVLRASGQVDNWPLESVDTSHLDAMVEKLTAKNSHWESLRMSLYLDAHFPLLKLFLLLFLIWALWFIRALLASEEVQEEELLDSLYRSWRCSNRGNSFTLSSKRHLRNVLSHNNSLD